MVDDGEGRREYFKSKKYYEEMIERKKQEEGQRVLKRIVEDKTGKTFWEEINKGRKRREGVDERITEGGGTSGNSWEGRKEGKWWS